MRAPTAASPAVLWPALLWLIWLWLMLAVGGAMVALGLSTNASPRSTVACSRSAIVSIVPIAVISTTTAAPVQQ